jgi:hypothetical protein
MMNCPPEIAEILLDMLEWEVIKIRSFGWEGRADQCAVAADHIHNLPRLLAEYHPEGLLYYWDTERVCYLEKAPPEHLPAWESFWERLEPHVEATRRSLVHS